MDPFVPGDVLWLSGEHYRSCGRPNATGSWALKVSAPPQPSGFPGWWHVTGWELNSHGEEIQYRAVCVPETTHRRARPNDQLEQRPPIGEDLRGTASGRPWNFPGRIQFPWFGL